MNANLNLFLFCKGGEARTLHAIHSDLGSLYVSGIYFSAHWCPPCRGFTPKLKAYYEKIKAEGKEFEIVFVSCDRDDASCKEYFSSMPWKLLPFENEQVSNI